MRLLLAALALFSPIAWAQVTVTLTSSAPAGISPHSHTLTWSSAGATSCVASGSWSGAKATSGTQTVTNLTANAAYRLQCSGAPIAQPCSAEVTWTLPTTNTDGSPLTNLAATDVSYGANCSALPSVVAVPAPGNRVTLNNLSGSTCVGAKVRTTTGQQSDLSNTATKTCPAPAAQTGSAEAQVTVDTKPAPPTGLTITNTAAYDLRWDAEKFAMVRNRVVGTAKLGAACNEAKTIGDGWHKPYQAKAVTLRRTPQFGVVVQCG